MLNRYKSFFEKDIQYKSFFKENITPKDIEMMESQVSYFKEEIQASQVAKDLIKHGYKKYEIKRINFQNVPEGDYTIQTLNKYGNNLIMIAPTNGADIDRMKNILSKYNPDIINGYIVIKRVQ